MKMQPWKEPDLSNSAPSFSSVLKDCTVVEGQDFVLQCSVQGNPVPQITWLLNGESPDFHFEQKGTQHSLCIQEVFPEDTGTYTCEAWNSSGEVRTQAVLTVQGEA
uniref:Ig-like domain-containing protein n=1 Tax=Urocitellus parryii TaxID=9999 RepID=A0A8D2IBE6_UROPR